MHYSFINAVKEQVRDVLNGSEPEFSLKFNARDKVIIKATALAITDAFINVLNEVNFDDE